MIPAPKWQPGTRPTTRATEVFGWTTEAELAFLGWFLTEQYSGAGEVVELGTALGRSTVAMLEGMAASPRASGRKLWAYDLFEFDWLLAREFNRLPGNESRAVAPGDSFERIFRDNLGELAARAEIVAGDIARHPWRGGPIEFLFIDIMKSWAATRAVIEGFFPFLEPGRSVIVHQDFKHPYSPQIVLTMFRLRAHFEPIWSVTGNGYSASVAFRCTRALDSATLERAMREGLCDLGSYSIDEIESAFDLAMGIVAGDPPEEIAMLAAARTVLFTNLLASRPELAEAAASIPVVCDYVLDRTARFRNALPSPPDVPEPSPAAEPARAELDRLRAERAALEQALLAAEESGRAAATERDEALAVLSAIHRSRAGRLAAGIWSWRRRLGV